MRRKEVPRAGLLGAPRPGRKITNAEGARAMHVSSGPFYRVKVRFATGVDGLLASPAGRPGPSPPNPRGVRAGGELLHGPYAG